MIANGKEWFIRQTSKWSGRPTALTKAGDVTEGNQAITHTAENPVFGCGYRESSTVLHRRSG
jgi:hypothetical protein